MKTSIRSLFYILLTASAISILSAFLSPVGRPLGDLLPAGKGAFRFPFRQAGLTERQAAAHLISRFTYGAMPGQVDEVVQMGLENWFSQQLAAGLPDDSLNQLLSGYDALGLSNEEIVNTYPKGGQLLRMAAKDGVIQLDSVKADRKEYRDVLKQYMAGKGYKPEQELLRQFICQKILRAACTHNQLQEVMTDFWFNHFNVSIVKNDCADFIPDYERDVIRPGALGKFGDLLLATAKSPAMLYYLDNFSSSGAKAENPVRMSGAPMAEAPVLKPRKVQGLNENYAREVMELHTLGVDGGYTQQDVTQAARVLTGWTVYPMGQAGQAALQRMNQFTQEELERRGFVRDGDFLFTPNRHDKGEKTILGKRFRPDGGYQEGVQLLGMLAHHPSTARFICRKIAVRFVSDDPPQSLVDKMTRTFLDKDGDIRQVLITMASSPEFWNTQALREKTKSPFELAIGSVRSLRATIGQPYQLFNWISRMGEKIYYYQAPTGFPDKGQYWINTGSLLNRMNFGLALASGRIPGIGIDLAALNEGHEPESAEAALVTYGRIIMPERNLSETVKRLTPLLSDPELVQKVDAASNRAGAERGDGMTRNDGMEKTGAGDIALQTKAENHSMLSQVVGIIIGSPEYQRR
jgi:uncharacterized protein (DUF1800 family)